MQLYKKEVSQIQILEPGQLLQLLAEVWLVICNFIPFC